MFALKVPGAANTANSLETGVTTGGGGGGRGGEARRSWRPPAAAAALVGEKREVKEMRRA